MTPDVIHRVRVSHRKSHQPDAGNGQGLVLEPVALFRRRAPMGGIVQFNRSDHTQRGGITNDEIDVLRRDPVELRAPVVADIHHLQHIRQTDFDEDPELGSQGQIQNPEKRSLRRRQQGLGRIPRRQWYRWCHHGVSRAPGIGSKHL